MKKLLSVLASALVLASGGAMAGFAPEKRECPELSEGCKAAYLMDYASGECIYKVNETERLPIASVCKVMTLTLCLDAVRCGKINFGDSVTVSDNAAGMGGSQVFLESGSEYTVDQLVKSIVVCSANDSCVAMSEKIAGSEDEFVIKMNEKAKEIGCDNTLFANCTGLPKDTQYSCARDVALMFGNLLGYEDYFKYSKIWLEDFTHTNNRVTSMTNTNKLIKKYGPCDGGKTGFTNEAGFCLASTAKKNDLRLVSVVLGGDTSDNRFNSAIKMFEYGFANYKNRIVLDSGVTLNDEFAISGGKKGSFAVRPERNSYVFSAVDKSPEISYNVITYNVKAPLAEGSVVGEIEVYKDGVMADKVNIVAAESVDKANFGDYFKNNAAQWAI